MTKNNYSIDDIRDALKGDLSEKVRLELMDDALKVIGGSLLGRLIVLFEVEDKAERQNVEVKL